MICFASVCLLNLDEDERSKPCAWIPVGWLPVYIDDRAKKLRPKQGYESIAARKMRIYHRCWIEFLDGWEERTRDAMILPWGDGTLRSTRIFFGGLLGDQQEGDKYTAEPVVCHRCTAARKDYLYPDAPAQVKTSKGMRLKVETAAAGAHLKGKRGDRWVVKWDSDGRNVRPGPGRIFHFPPLFYLLIMHSGARYYESERKKAGAHLLFNAFWLIPHFCVNLMYLRDPMHQIDNGVIISFCKAILRKFFECVERVLGVTGLAAEKLTSRLKRLLGKYTSASGHKYGNQ